MTPTHTIKAAGWYTDAAGIAAALDTGATIALDAASAAYLELAGQVEPIAAEPIAAPEPNRAAPRRAAGETDATAA